MPVEVRSNLPAFNAQLDALGADFERRVVRSAANAAAQAFKRTALAEVPVRSGKLKRALYVKRDRRSAQRGTEHYIVSFRKGRAAQNIKVYRGFTGNLDAYYGRFLEAGWIPRGPGKKMRGGTRSRALQRERAGGEKITTYRFLRPAFDHTRDEALRRFYVKIEQRIAKENRKT